VISYRDTWRLFLRYVAASRRRPVAKLRLQDLTATDVLAFLKDCEERRKVSIGTRNCRLAALRGFFAFLVDREPLAAGQCAEVLRIPAKRARQRELCYLEEHEVAAILAQPDRSTLEGQRDHVLLAFLYNTGARIQEALDLCTSSLRLESPAQVRLIGKGRKERIWPLWPETTTLLRALLQRVPRQSDQTIFVNSYGEPLGAAGVRFKLQQCVQRARKKASSLMAKRVSPHTFRHTAAVHLVAAGVDVTVIRSWLGCAHLDTTNHYARATVEMKRKALEKITGPSRPVQAPHWKREADLMTWLDSL
jgi:integrase/recombinase XerC